MKKEGVNEPKKERICDVLEETFARYDKKAKPSSAAEETQKAPAEEKASEALMAVAESVPPKIVKTGIIGFDNSVGGGIQDHTLIFVCGENGSHYDTMVQQILYNHIMQNGKAAYYLGETLSIDVKHNMQQFSWTLQDHIRKDYWKFVDMRTPHLQELAELCPRLLSDQDTVRLTPGLSELKSDLYTKIKNGYWTALELNHLLFNYELKDIIGLILFWRALIRLYGGVHFLILPLDIHPDSGINALKNLTDIIIEFRLKESVREYENVMTIRKVKTTSKPLMLHFLTGESGIVIETVARIA